MNMFKKNGGFTLVELIVVIAILAILAGIAVPAYTGYITKAKNAGEEVKQAYSDRLDKANAALTAAGDSDLIDAEEGFYINGGSNETPNGGSNETPNEQ